MLMKFFCCKFWKTLEYKLVGHFYVKFLIFGEIAFFCHCFLHLLKYISLYLGESHSRGQNSIIFNFGGK
jgi:hypothetical protein